MKRARIAFTAAVTLLASGATAATDLAAEISARAARQGLPAQPLLAPVEEARRLGLPPDPVADKVLEGLAKGVAPERVAAVARDLVSRLEQADAVLAQARQSGLAPAADRAAALGDLAQALQAGVDRPSLEALVASAREGHGGAGAVTAAARTLGQLSRRGVPPAESLSLGRALAQRPGEAGEVPALFDAWRAEGGRDVHAFLAEAQRRVAAGRPLQSMVDRFGDTPDRVVRDNRTRGDDGAADDPGRRGKDKGLAPGERSDAARGAVPGLDDAVRGRGKKP